MPTFNGSAQLDGLGAISEIQGSYGAATLAGQGYVQRIFFDSPTLAGRGFVPRLFLDNPANLSGLGTLRNPIVPVLLGQGVTGAGTSFTIVTSDAIPAGAVAFAWFLPSSTNRPLASVSDGTNSYTIINSTTSTIPQGAYFYYPSGLAAGTTITFTTSGPAGGLLGGICYIPNVTATPFDQDGANIGSSNPTTALTTANLTQSHEMAISICRSAGNVTLTAGPVGLALLAQRNSNPSYFVSYGEVFTNVAAPYQNTTSNPQSWTQATYTFEFLPWVSAEASNGAGAVSCAAAQIFADSSEVLAGAGAISAPAVQIFRDSAETISGTGAVICSASQKWTTNPATLAGLGACASDSVHTPSGAATASGAGAVICAACQIWTTNPALLGGVGGTICAAAHTPIDTAELLSGGGAVTANATHTPADTNDVLAGLGAVICGAAHTPSIAATLAGLGAVVANAFPAAIDTGETISGGGALACGSVHTVFDQIEIFHGAGAASAPGTRFLVDAGPENLGGVGAIFAESEFQVIITGEIYSGLGSCTATTIQTFTDSGEGIAGSGAIVCNTIQKFTNIGAAIAGSGALLLDAVHPVPAACALQAFSFISNPIVPVGIGTGGNGNGTNFQITTTVPVPAGATLVVYSVNTSGGHSMVSVSDGSNVYALNLTSGIGGVANIASAGPLQAPLPAGSSITVSVGGAATVVSGGAFYLVGSWVHEQVATDIVDVAVLNSGTGNVTAAISSGVLAQPYEMAIYVVGVAGNVTGFQGPLGFARLAADARDVDPSAEVWYTNTINNGGLSAQSSWGVSQAWGQTLITFIQMFATVSGAGSAAASAIWVSTNNPATLSGGGALFANSVHTVIDQSEAVAGSGALRIDAAHTPAASVLLPGAGALVTSTLQIWAASAVPAGSGVILANGVRAPAGGSQEVDGLGAVIVAPSIVAVAAAALAGGSAVVAIGANHDIGTAAIVGGGALASAASHTPTDAAESYAGLGILAAGAVLREIAQAATQGGGALSLDAVHIVGSDRPIYSGDGEMAVDSVHTAVDPAELMAGSGAVIAKGLENLSGGSIAIGGNGSLACGAVARALAAPAIAGAGKVAVDSVHAPTAAAALIGNSTLVWFAPQFAFAPLDGVGTCAVGSTTQLLSSYSPQIQVRTIPLRRRRRRFG